MTASLQRRTFTGAVAALGLGAVLAAAAPFATAQILADLRKKGELTVGVLVDFPPCGTTNANNQPDGYDADVARLLANTFEDKFVLRQQEMTMALRPDQDQLLKTVNDFIARDTANGELSKLYRKWLERDLLAMKQETETPTAMNERVLISLSSFGAGDGGLLDSAAPDRALVAAQTLGAPRLKMAIGHYGAGSLPTLTQLKQRLAAGPVELVIENDQTAAAGSLVALQVFFAAAAARGLPLGMTFDMGNWHWVGECPLQAAQALAPHVRYVHCKGVQRQPQRWTAVPLADSAAPWRAVLRALPAHMPWAIEYPLVADDLLARTRDEISQLRDAAALAKIGS